MSVSVPNNVLSYIDDSSEALTWVGVRVMEIEGTSERRVYIVVGRR